MEIVVSAGQVVQASNGSLLSPCIPRLRSREFRNLTELSGSRAAGLESDSYARE